MGANDRIDVLCAAQLEGPGHSRWSPCRLTVSALSRAGKIEVTAYFQEGSYGSRGQGWSFSSRPKTEADAVALVRSMAEHPADAFDRGKIKATPEQRESLKALFSGLKITLLLDTTQGQSDLQSLSMTVGAGRYLAAQIEQGAALTPELTIGITQYFSKAPFTFGYWAPYKRLVKLLETRSDAVALLAIALARIDGRLHRVANVQANDQLRSYLPVAPSRVAGPDTLAYLMRRGRRWLRRLGRTDENAYFRSAFELLKAADTQGAHTQIASRWILADVLYGRAASDTSHGHGPLALPAATARYSRRWDRFPKVWNEKIPALREIWQNTANNPDIQIWAYNVLKSQRQDPPALPNQGLKLALRSPSERVRGIAFTQLSQKPDLLLEMDLGTVQIFLELSSPKQFAAAYHTLESHAGVKSIQDAVLTYIEKHGLVEIRRGSLPSKEGKRSATLLQYSLRLLRSRFNPTDTYHLARYVGQTTQFKPIAQWRDTLRELPIKSLVELRLHLPDLPKIVARSIDAACRDAVAQGAGDEKLAAALTLSPSPDLRALGWALLVNAGDSTVATVWNNLIAQAGAPNGLQSILEALRFKDRLVRIEGHSSGARWLSSLVTLTASVDPKMAEALLLRLAAKGDSQQTLATMAHLVNRTNAEAWITKPTLHQKVVGIDPTIARLVWASVNAASPTQLAQIYAESRSLAGAVVDAADAGDIKALDSFQADYLAYALRSSPSRLYQDREFAVACATCPQPALQQLAIARLESRRLVEAVFIPLAESGMPAAVAAAERYIASIRDRSALTKAVITVCDSGVKATREIGLHYIDRKPDRLDLNATLLALAEHTAPEITATVAKFAAKGAAIKKTALEQFDNRVLRTRRVGRQSKELVKSRLEELLPDVAVSIDANQRVDDRRIQALVDMARGSSLRDRDWALQQLARLALDGYAIPDVQISTTS